MQEQALLKKLKNKTEYKNPNSAVVMGILHSQENTSCIIKELYDMLQDNFLKTESILGEEITNLVISQKMKSNKIVLNC
jgi:hypothetical protein